LAASSIRSLVGPRTTSGLLKNRETVAGETPARAATSTMPGAPFLDLFRFMTGRIVQNENVCIIVFIV
jgi:hypothetical protein